MAEPGKLQPYAPLDPQALHCLAQHALDVLMPAAIGTERETLGEAGAQLAIALSEFARLVEADADDQLPQGEEVVERLRRASLHVYEHMAATVPPQELNARNVELLESCMEEGLPVVGAVTAELLLADGQAAAVRLTKETAHQEVELNGGHTARLSTADHLIVRDGFHELARLLAPLARATSTGRDLPER
jgi:hypothetical protein